MSKYLFSSVREQPAVITELYDEDDIVMSSSANLAKVRNSFYSKLYECLALDKLWREYGVELLSYILSKFSPIAQKVLETPLTEKELTKVVQALAKEKTQA